MKNSELLGKKGKKLGLAIGLLVLIIGCVHELPMPVDPGGGGGGGGIPPQKTCSADTVYFTNTILPLVNSLCGKSGCHGTTNPRNFTMLTYSSIKNRLGTTSKISNALGDMAEKKVDNPALDYTAPDGTQTDLLNKWARQGAKDNQCSACDTTQFAYAANIKPIIDAVCKGCHNGPTGGGGIDLSSVTAVQAEISGHPGRLLGSIQWASPYNTAKSQMPQGGSKLDSCSITLIRKWIDDGYKNN